MNYVDPSGHRPCDDGFECSQREYKSTIVGGCSVFTGGFNGSHTCTADDMNFAPIKDRQSWLNDMLETADAGLSEQFNNIDGILQAFIDTNSGAPGSWVSWGDAGILVSIQNGLASYLDEKFVAGYQPADSAWEAYFGSYFKFGPNDNNTMKLWGLVKVKEQPME